MKWCISCVCHTDRSTLGATETRPDRLSFKFSHFIFISSREEPRSASQSTSLLRLEFSGSIKQLLDISWREKRRRVSKESEDPHRGQGRSLGLSSPICLVMLQRAPQRKSTYIHTYLYTYACLTQVFFTRQTIMKTQSWIRRVGLKLLQSIFFHLPGFGGSLIGPAHATHLANVSLPSRHQRCRLQLLRAGGRSSLEMEVMGELLFFAAHWLLHLALSLFNDVFTV